MAWGVKTRGSCVSFEDNAEILLKLEVSALLHVVLSNALLIRGWDRARSLRADKCRGFVVQSVLWMSVGGHSSDGSFSSYLKFKPVAPFFSLFFSFSLLKVGDDENN